MYAILIFDIKLVQIGVGFSHLVIADQFLIFVHLLMGLLLVSLSLQNSFSHLKQLFHVNILSL